MCALVTVACAIVAGFTLSVASEANVPLFQRRAAAEVACKDAAAALQLELPSAITFTDDCRQPKVTPMWSRPGYLIVTRVAHAPSGRETPGTTYSVLMDGRHVDAWRLVEVRSGPNELSIVQAPPALSGVGVLSGH